MDYDLSNDYAYHKYKSDNLSIFNDYVSQFDSIQNQFLNFDGKMNGQILVNNRFPLKNFIDIELDSFRLSNVFSVKKLKVVLNDVSDHQQRYVLAFDNFDFNQDHIDYFDTEVQYFPKKRRLESTQQNFRYQGRAIKNIFLGLMNWTHGFLICKWICKKMRHPFYLLFLFLLNQYKMKVGCAFLCQDL